MKESINQNVTPTSDILPAVSLQHIKDVYFLGIGGIGMSALARFFKAKGFNVAGYDRTASQLTRELVAEGITVHYDDNTRDIEALHLDKRSTLVVRTPAVSTSLSQYQYFVQNGFTVAKRAEVLGFITRQMRALCVAGTHGKTTTSSILAHLMHQSDVDCNAFLGGISNNIGSNVLLSPDSNYVVVEADEFDRSFHHLQPWMTIITSIDADHLDIYGTAEAYRESFAHYTSLIRPGGALVMKQGLPLEPRLQAGVRLYTYAVNEPADFYADNIIVENGKIQFDFHTPNETIAHLRLGVPIYINIENSVAAMAVAWLNGVTSRELRVGIASYSGVYRRFNVYESRVHKSISGKSISGEAVSGEAVSGESKVVVDDYAHHPEELRASIDSIRMLYPGKHITGVFQPHLYTRTRDFADAFAAVLSRLDCVILLPIYPAREEPIDGVDSQMLLDKITSTDKVIVPKEELLIHLKSIQTDVIMTLGAGDIDRLVPQIVQQIKED